MAWRAHGEKEGGGAPGYSSRGLGCASTEGGSVVLTMSSELRRDAKNWKSVAVAGTEGGASHSRLATCRIWRLVQ